MKAVIFNSGLGNRMGEFTAKNHKSMARLKDGETIFHRQIRLLSAEGITEFIVTTGPFEEQLKAEAADFPALNFTFVRNAIYDKTNYIYSMYLAREHMNDDLLFLHGDLVFNRKLLHDVLVCPDKNLIMEFCKYGSRIEVLSPEEVRTAVKEELEKAANLYR